MVTSSRSGKQLMIVAKPDHSSNWHTNMLLLLALSVPCLGAALIFTLAGAWPILPLAGLELTALGIALYTVNRKLSYRHVITVNGDTLSLDKGFDSPCQHWQFERHKTGLCICAESHPQGGPALTLHNRSEQVSLGEFLGREDTLALIELLRGEINVRTDSEHAQVRF